MASPQLENGHLRIANELAEALMKAPMNGQQWRIVMGVIRESYGWNRKLAPLSMRRLAAMTRMDRRNVRREVGVLVSAGVVIRQEQDVGGTLLGIGKDYEAWKFNTGRGRTHPRGLIHPRGRGSISDQEVVASSPPNKRQKDILKKNKRAALQPADPRYQPIVAHYLKRTEEATGAKPFDIADGKNLRGLLARNPETPLAEIIQWLDNAFDSTEVYPLRPGFRMTEFCRHYAKYTHGPLHKAGARHEHTNRTWIEEAKLT